ncbi:hypothetical protein IGI04_023581 [Brassica rapa subsp. trilocularis]|uniref:Uncharacterized protein n=1 Tax=Brassica rapa subsp. trilocularis TaxID=1813537 RepID=A0ABQ7M4A3_BRACM|nr:hypothetical protein IGI04_023581 [Brassica rapa subsp. trilocularis]
MKAFAAQLFQQNFFVMQERLHKQMGENFEKIQYELKDLLKDASIEAEHGELSTSKPSPSKLLSRRFKRLCCLCISMKCDMFYIVSFWKCVWVDVNLSQADDINEWICTQGLEGLSQSSYVPGFDPSQTNKDNEPNDWWTPMTTVQNYQKLNQCKKLQLQHRQSGRNGLKNQARNLSFVIHQWRKMVLRSRHSQRIICAEKWLGDESINRVAFMSAMFCLQIETSYRKFVVNKRAYKLPNLLLAYGREELAAHGRTDKKVEVFNCLRRKNRKSIEKFAARIIRILKAAGPPENKKKILLS